MHADPIIKPLPAHRSTWRSRSTRIKGAMDQMEDRRQNRCGQRGNLNHKSVGIIQCDGATYVNTWMYMLSF